MIGSAMTGAALQGSGAGDNTCGGDGGGCGYGMQGGVPYAGSGAGFPPNACNCCVDGATKISMADGTETQARDIWVGAEVRGMDRSGCPAVQTVTQVRSGHEGRFKIGLSTGELICSASHPLATSLATWVKAQNLTVGDLLMGSEGNEVEVKSIESMDSGEVWIFTCTPDHNFIAAGVLHHNHAIAKPGNVQMLS